MGFSSWPPTLLRFVPPDPNAPKTRAEILKGQARGRQQTKPPTPGFEWRERIKETVATCSDCVRCRPEATVRFLPESKCCTHVPFFPNFAVGEILRAGGPAAETVRSRLHTLSALPLGLIPTPGEEAVERARGPGAFGQDARVVCPFLKQGGCSVWAHRPAVCASYYCETSHGDHGRSLWQRAEAYFGFVEHTLATEVLAQRGFLDDEIALSWRWLPSEAPKTEALTPKFQSAAWLEFDQDREGFYLKADEIVRSLQSAEIWQLMGADGLHRWRDLEGVARATVSSMDSAAYFAARDAAANAAERGSE